MSRRTKSILLVAGGEGEAVRRLVQTGIAVVAVVLTVASTAAGQAPQSGTYLYLNGYPGGEEQLFTPADSTFSAGVGNLLEIFVFPDSGGPCCTGGSWHLFFAAPPGQELDPGVYEGAVPFGPQAPGEPMLDVFQSFGGSSRCSGGRFVVTEAYFAFGSVVAFDATFEQACFGDTVTGRLRIEPPPDTQPPTIVVSDVLTEAQDAGGAAVTYSAFASDDVDPSPSLSCDHPSGTAFPVGTTTVTCTASDFTGKSSSATFTVTVLPLLELGITFLPGSVDAGTGAAVVRGTVSCNRPANVFLNGTLEQTVARRVTVAAQFSTQLECAPPRSAWSATAVAPIGRFSAGKARITAQAFNCEFVCHIAFGEATVRFSGGGK